MSWLDTVADDSFGKSLEFVPFSSSDLDSVAKRLSLSQAFIDLARQGYKSLEAERRLKIIETTNVDLPKTLSARISDIRYALAKRAKLYLCPFTGRAFHPLVDMNLAETASGVIPN